MTRLFLNIITFYQKYLSFDNGALAMFAPGGACRFPVRCSEYTKQMIKEYGVSSGILLGIKRIWSCR